MADIAREAGISRASVSYILNDAPLKRYMNKETIRRVNETAARLGYIANDAARAVRTGKSRTLLFLTPKLRWESNINVVHGASIQAFSSGYQLKYLPIDPLCTKAEEVAAHARNRMSAGVITLNLPLKFLEQLAPLLKEAEIPLLQVGDAFPNISDLSVQADHASGARETVDHLVKLGHRQIAAMFNSHLYSSTMLRRKGFEAALKSHGIKMPKSYFREGRFDPRRIAEETRHLLALNPRPTAIFCDTDPSALAVLFALRKAGIRVPEDISVTGFVNLPLCDFTDPPLTSVDLPAEALGEKAAQCLIEIAEGLRQTADTTPEFLPTRLVVRESTGPVT